MVKLEYVGENKTPTVVSDKVSIEDIPVITEHIEEILGNNDVPMKVIFQINIAIDEMYSNIAKFAYESGKEGSASVSIDIKPDVQTLYVSFTDEGEPYNPLEQADPDTTLSAEERDIGGLGIFMVKKSMDDMLYKYEDGKNILTLVKKI
ncbi:MAG: ATP-binding protein [Oscillospiraceae bacterium]|nr:ATP-binding protein [Candidatus Equicaccousia limihippi]